MPVYNDLNLFIADGHAAFSRKSPKRGFNAAGDLVEIDVNQVALVHDPISHVRLGALIEGYAANALTRSQEFDNAIWEKVETSVQPNATTAPDGSNTADMLVESSANDTHLVRRSSGTRILFETVYTFSVFLKDGGRFRGRLANIVSGAGYQVDFNLNAGTVSGGAPVGDGEYIGAGIKPIDNGWYRVWVTGKLPEGVYTANPQIILQDNSGQTVYTGNGTSGLYVWGAQLEKGPVPTSYIPTTDQRAMRLGDLFDVRLKSVEFHAPAWTLFVDFEALDEDEVTDSYAFAIPGAADTTITSLESPQVQSYKAAVSWDGSSYRLAINGAVQEESSSPPPANVVQFALGRSVRHDKFLLGYVKALSYWAFSMSDAQLIALTQS